MSSHVMFDFEIKAVVEAAEQLAFPQEGKGDNRQMYQRIFHIMEEVKQREGSEWIV
jgi:hypothetical protein